MTAFEKAQAKQEKRLAELASFGIKAGKGGGVLGSIWISATEAEKVLKLLRRLRKLEQKVMKE